MTRTTTVLTAPEQGTVIQPVYQYSAEQHAQAKELRAVRRLSFSDTFNPQLSCRDF